jgi:hypothetical protein
MFGRGLDEHGVEVGFMEPSLFRFVDGRWTPLERFEQCDAGRIPDDIWDIVCNSG